MNNKLLEEIRQVLQNKANRQYKDVNDDYSDGQFGAMLLVEDVAKANQSRELLEMLPEPEHEAVLDYQALCRVVGMDFEHDANSLHDTERELYQKLAEKEKKAQEVVKNRLEVEHKDDGGVLLKDPVTKVRMLYEPGMAPDDGVGTDLIEQNFARDIVNHGVERP